MDSETFDFVSLPYVCQRRIVELLDSKTLLNFASINSETKKLAKFLHVVEEAKVTFKNNDETKVLIEYKLKCFCDEENERCNLDHETYQPPRNSKVDVMNEITIIGPRKFWADPNYFNNPEEPQMLLSLQIIENLPLNFYSVKRLKFDSCLTTLDDLEKILKDKPELKDIVYGYRLKSHNCSIDEFVVFLRSLSKFDSFSFELFHNLDNDSFNFKDLVGASLDLQEEKIFDNCIAEWNYLIFYKGLPRH